jgi:hypothetical protein
MPRQGPVTAWLMSLSDAELAYAGGTALALLIVVGAIIVLAVRSCKGGSSQPAYMGRMGEIGPARADEYDTLQVIVQAHNQEAELEVQTDAWSSYEELRELVVDAVPQMFRDTDELTLEYLDRRQKWTRVKMRTPVDAVKAARSARITATPAAAAAAPGRRQ